MNLNNMTLGKKKLKKKMSIEGNNKKIENKIKNKSVGYTVDNDA